MTKTTLSVGAFTRIPHLRFTPELIGACRCLHVYFRGRDKEC